MMQFEDKLSLSAQRTAEKENLALHVPTNPVMSKRPYWGWVAAPAAAVAGIVLGMSVDALAGKKPEIRYVQTTDTVQIERPVRDTIYLTKVVERVRTVERPIAKAASDADEDSPACTSVQCDGINYAALALN